MKRTILTAVTAAALALSPMATAPARAADAHDIIGTILGVAALAAIANELNEDRSPQYGRSSRRVTYDDGRYGRNGSYDRNRRYAQVLPGECLRVLDGGRTDSIVFPERCLNSNGIRTSRLPQRCESTVRTRQGRLDVYHARCLADAGWRLPRIARR